MLVRYDGCVEDVYKGVIFKMGDDYRLDPVYRPRNSMPLVEFGNCVVMNVYYRDRSIKNHGFFKFKLDKNLPEIFLDTKKNGLFSFRRAPVYASRKEILNSSDGFDEHFRILVSPGYGDLARQIFSNDILSLVLSLESTFDIEIAGGEVYLYTKGRFPFINSINTKKLLNDASIVFEALKSRIESVAASKVETEEGGATTREAVVVVRHKVGERIAKSYSFYNRELAIGRGFTICFGILAIIAVVIAFLSL